MLSKGRKKSKKDAKPEATEGHAADTVDVVASLPTTPRTQRLATKQHLTAHSKMAAINLHVISAATPQPAIRAVTAAANSQRTAVLARQLAIPMLLPGDRQRHKRRLLAALRQRPMAMQATVKAKAVTVTHATAAHRAARLIAGRIACNRTTAVVPAQSRLRLLMRVMWRPGTYLDRTTTRQLRHEVDQTLLRGPNHHCNRLRLPQRLTPQAARKPECPQYNRAS